MSREQYDWCERKGIEDVGSYEYLKQDDKYVYFKRPDIGLIIKRKKDIVGLTF